MSSTGIALNPSRTSAQVLTEADVASILRDVDARPTPSEAEALEFSPKGLLIDGRFVPASGGRTVGVEDPVTGRTIAKVADATPADCLAALEAAVGAQGAICSPRARVRTRRA